MKKIVLFSLLILSFSGCRQVKYTSVSKPQINTNTSNHYFVSKDEKKYQGNDSVEDINTQDSKHDILIVEDDGTYQYIK